MEFRASKSASGGSLLENKLILLYFLSKRECLRMSVVNVAIKGSNVCVVATWPTKLYCAAIFARILRFPSDGEAGDEPELLVFILPVALRLSCEL